MKRILSFFLVPLTRWYLKKRRSYFKHGVKIRIEPGVFHPGLFFSTNYLWNYFKSRQIQSKTFLELGCGSGYISILAANKGAKVTATDISSTALDNARYNAEKNEVRIAFYHSNLFENIKKQKFDFVAINPPYYKGQIKKQAEHAWYAGASYEYFDNLFASLNDYIGDTSEVIMVLSDDCDIGLIQSKAHDNGFMLEMIDQKKFWLEVNYLFRIRSVAVG